MAEKPQPRPEGFHTVNPYLVVQGAARVLDFLTKAFGAEEVGQRFKGPDGAIMHAAVRIGDSMVEVGDGGEEAAPATLHMYVEDPDAVYRRAIEAGGTSLREPETTFYGERSAAVKDPGGNRWYLACHVEEVAEEEILRRMTAQSKEGRPG